MLSFILFFFTRRVQNENSFQIPDVSKFKRVPSSKFVKKHYNKTICFTLPEYRSLEKFSFCQLTGFYSIPPHLHKGAPLACMVNP